VIFFIVILKFKLTICKPFMLIKILLFIQHSSSKFNAISANLMAL